MKRFPNTTKFKSNHQVKLNYFKLLDKKTFFLLYGDYGIKSLESGKLTYKQMEACRRTLRRGLKKQGKL
jgi:ribosomal protein L16/L10AE